MLGWEVCTRSSPVWSEPERYRTTGSGGESRGASWECLIHLEIPHCSFRIPFPSFKSDSGFLQLSHCHCQTNLRKLGALVSLGAVDVWGFRRRRMSSDRLVCSLFA